MAEKVFVGVDIGGSHIGVGIVRSTGELLLESEAPITGDITPTDAVLVIAARVQGMFKELSEDNTNYKIAAVGIGCPGQAYNGILVAASNLRNFKNVPLAQMVSDALGGLPTALLNDADAAISAEVWGTSGIYDEFSNIAMITLGTGIGSALILDGQLYQGSYGLVEGGHMIVSSSKDARLCSCGQRGCVEAYASAANTAKRLCEVDAQAGKNSDTLTGKEVFNRYNNGDAAAIQVLEETAEHLATMCINLCRIVDPQVIIFGGGLSKAGEDLIDLVYKHFHAKSWTVLPSNARLLLSQSGNSGVVGAALAAQNKFGKHKLGQSTIGTQNKQLMSCSLTISPSACWIGPAIAVSSAVALALTIKPELTTSSVDIKKALFTAQMGLGLMFSFWFLHREANSL